LRAGIVGAGPAGLYCAAALRKHADIEVDIFDVLPTPYGLVRYGVAPDHLKIKSVMGALQEILEDPQVRFLGNVRVGTDVSVDELRSVFDAVIYACGAPADRKLNIPGEDLPGSVSSTEVVSWYSGHPDAVTREVFNARSAVVIGAGNVAIDIARFLAKAHQEFQATDIPDHVLDALATSAITDIHLVARRPATHTRFTTKELRELGELTNADVLVDPEELVLDDVGKARYDADATARRNFETLREWSQREASGRGRRIHLRFSLRPVAIEGRDQVAAVVFERTHLEADGDLVGAGERETIEAQLVVRAVGYRGTPLGGVPFDDANGTIPNAAGRVLRDGEPVIGEYVAGWIKRGPTGVIGSNRSDAAETAKSLLEDLAGGVLSEHAGRGDVDDLLSRKQVNVVPWDGWLAIDAAEIALGARRSSPRVKIHALPQLLAAATGPASPPGSGSARISNLPHREEPA
jgi:ferredoxin--NADP+ reductase